MYFDGRALVLAVVAVNETILDDIEDLAYDVEADPNPHILEVILGLAPHLKLLKLPHLLRLIPIRQVKEQNPQNDHHPINDQLSDFCIHYILPLHRPCPSLTSAMNIPSSVIQNTT